MPNSSSVDNSTEAEKANKGRKHRSKSTNTKGKSSLHPGQDRLGNLWQKNEQVRRRTTNLKKRQECHIKVRAGRRKPGARAEMPIHSLHWQRGSERSVGRIVAFWSCGPDARSHTRSPGRSTQSPGGRRKCLVDGRNPEVQGLVDEAVSLEEPGKAHKPDQRRQVSIRVSTVSKIENRPERAQQEDDPHGLLTHGQKWTSK
jgi:hypothetical protein